MPDLIVSPTVFKTHHWAQKLVSHSEYLYTRAQTISCVALHTNNPLFCQHKVLLIYKLMWLLWKWQTGSKQWQIMFLSPYFLPTLPIFFFYMYETVNSWTEAAMLCSQVTLRLYPLSPVLWPQGQTVWLWHGPWISRHHVYLIKACLDLIMFKQGFSTHCKSTSFEPVCELLSKVKGYILQCACKNCAPCFILLRSPAYNR